MTTNFNVEPYFDDYDKHKHFYKILFRPSYSLQAREMTQLQSMLQEQVTRMGDHLFKSGTMVIPGELSFDMKFSYVKLQPTFNSVNVSSFISSLIGLTLVGGTSGIKAQVLAAESTIGADPDTIFVKYLDSGSAGDSKKFNDNETLSPVDTGITGKNIQTAATNATGFGSAAIIKEGVYYIEGYFVLCEPQILVLDKYDYTPSYSVGFNILETIVTPEQDESLLDNAQGSYNFAAPGAHRYSISLELAKKITIDDTNDTSKYIQLTSLLYGAPQTQYNVTQYAELAKVMARRTYDESGDYVVRDFKFTVREHVHDWKGEWISGYPYIIGNHVIHDGYYYTARSNGISGDGAGTWPLDQLTSFNDGGINWRMNRNFISNRGVFTNEQGGDEGAEALQIDPGKAYVRGYEIEKVGTTFLKVPKARTVAHEQNGHISTLAGNYVLVTRVHGLPNLAVLPEVKLYSAMTTRLTLSTGVTTNGTTTVTSSGLFVGVVAGQRISGTNIPNDTFVATVDSTSSITISKSATGSTSGTGTALIFIGEGSATTNGSLIGTANIRFFEYHSGTVGTPSAVYKLGLFNVKLKDTAHFYNDIKQFFVDTGTISTNFTADIMGQLSIQSGAVTMVGSTGIITGVATEFTSFRTGDVINIGGNLHRITNIASNFTMTVAASPDAPVDVTNGSPLYLVTTDLMEPENSSLIFFIVDYVKNFRDNSNVNKCAYTVVESFTGTTNTSGVVVFSLGGGAGNLNLFTSPLISNNYIGVYGSGVLKPLTATEVSIDVSQKVCTVDFGIANASKPVSILATIDKAGIADTEKSKTEMWVSETITDQSRATSRHIVLPHADGREVVSILMDTGTWSAPSGIYSIEIINRYTFDDGQTDSYYDLCSVSLKDGQHAPIAPIKIIYSYWEHSSTGDYFTVNSYPIEYSKIGGFNGQAMSDVIDFRPRINNIGTGFSGAGASVGCIPRRGFNTRCEYEYYLGRIDKLCLEPTGDFHLISGTPAINPTAPSTSPTGMLMATITLLPFTNDPRYDVRLEIPDNRRYTMRDIGKLDRRITNLEYYTSLSMSEQATTNMTITDTNGLDRFKNGFIVDSFTGHGIGSTFSPDYLCAVDSDNRILRAFYTMKNITLYESNSSNRLSNHYQVTGDLVTLPYIHVAALTQPFASRTENINPFAVYSFVGALSINPEKDDWMETGHAPDVTTNAEGNFNSLNTSLENSGQLGTVWNAWQTVWTGTPTVLNIQQSIQTVGGDVTSTPGRAAVPEIPAIPATAGFPGTPAVPGVPATPGRPAIPYIEAQPAIPGTPAIPAVSAVPAKPAVFRMRWYEGDQYITGLIDKPAQPAIPGTPGSPGTPGRPAIPGQAYVPAVPGTPGIPAVPAVPATPGTPGIPGTPGQPAIQGVSVISAKTTTVITEQTMAQQIGQLRTGIITTVQPSITTELVSDRLISTAVVPYMRQRNVAFTSFGLKSNTRLYAYFDGICVDAYIVPSTLITLNTITGQINGYDYTSNAGVNANHAARIIGQNLDLSLNKGMILKGYNTVNGAPTTPTGATAIILYQEPPVSGATFVNVHVANVIGTFTTGDTIIGSLDGGTTGPRGIVAATPAVTKMGDVLTTNYAGVATGIFAIPANATMRFKTGQRELVLQDTMAVAPTTHCGTMYEASGLLETFQKNYISTRNGTVVRTAVSENQTLTNTFNKTSSVSATDPAITILSPAPVSYTDPLAQSFVIDTAGGIFVTKVDLFFATKETVQATPVHIEIREVVNGYPSNRTAPFSVVYKDPQHVSTSATGTVATTFVFPAPVHLVDGREYALVLLSDSNNYNVFISQMGQTDIATNKVISTQPTLGVLFKSSNGSTWTADQLQDLKFTMYRAKFDIANTGIISLNNGPTAYNSIQEQPFQATFGSKIVRVMHPDHHFPNGSKVEISGVLGTTGGIPASDFNKTHTITSIDPNAYTIEVATTATSSAIGGGTITVASENIQFDTLHTNITDIIFQNTSIDYGIKTTSGQSPDGNETAYFKDSSFQPIKINDNITFSSPRMIASTLNEVTFLSSAKSLDINAILTSKNDNVSPIIDLQRVSATLISNKINSPTLANTNIDVIDDRIILLNSVNKIAFSGTYNSIYTALTNTVEVAALSTLSAGKYINVSTNGAGVNIGDLMVIGTETIGTDFHVKLYFGVVTEALDPTYTFTITQHQKFIDELCPMWGSAFNKYISKEIILAQPSTYIKIKIAANIPASANVAIYYKTNPTGASIPLIKQNWNFATPMKSPVKTSNPGAFSDIDYDIENLLPFDTLQIKIVLTSTSTSQVPRCKELRIIACA